MDAAQTLAADDVFADGDQRQCLAIQNRLGLADAQAVAFPAPQFGNMLALRIGAGFAPGHFLIVAQHHIAQGLGVHGLVAL